MAGGSITERLIDVTFTLGSGTFANGSNQVKLQDHRVSVRISKAGGPSKNATEIKIYGVALATMNKLSTLGMIIKKLPNNFVTVEAGGPRPLSLVFEGTIHEAYADFQGSPEVALIVRAQAGSLAALVPVDAQSFTGKQKVSAIMAKIAAAMNLPLINQLPDGEDVTLTDQNLPGTAYEQMWSVAFAAQVGANVDDKGLLLYSLSTPGHAPAVPLSPTTGMVEYPTYLPQGMLVRAVFNPAIKFQGSVKITGSLVPQANGTWYVTGIDHALDSKLPNGSWFSDLYLYNAIANPDDPPPIQQ